MTPYIHHRIPEIEKYANQLQWMENTLEDRYNTKVFVENTLLDLEKQLDEGSFLQVPEESQVQEESEAPNLSDIPEKSDRPEQSKKTDRPEATMSTPPVLQTPLNEEKGKKRDREEATPISGPAEQPGAKRQRLNPLSEEEIIEETIESLRGERATNP